MISTRTHSSGETLKFINTLRKTHLSEITKYESVTFIMFLKFLTTIKQNYRGNRRCSFFLSYSLSAFLICFHFIGTIYAQPQVIDKVIAVIGDNVLLLSDLENQKIQHEPSGYVPGSGTSCTLLEDLLFQKLLLNQAQLDSVEISEAQIQSELERRLRFFINQIGSEEKLEEYYQKSISEIKSDFHDLIKDQLLAQTMQQKITGNIKITPAEIKSYFDKIPGDSLPLISSEMEVAQIVKKPVIRDEEKKAVKDKLEALRNRVLKGEDFGTLAYLYSEDPGSAKQNGELGFVTRTALVPEFASVAFSIKPGEVSEIIETDYGYHIIQLIEKRGEQVNVRHILLSPKVAPEDLITAKNYLDSIYTIMNTHDTLTFELAAQLFSDDKDSKMNGGKIINPQTGTIKFDAELLGQYDPMLFFTVEKMKTGEQTQAIIWQKTDGSQAYRIVKLLSRTEPHRANLKDDYQKIQEVALQEKQNDAMKNWIVKKVKKTYIKIENEYKDCKFENHWINIEN